MKKKVILAGLSGGIVMFGWLFLTNAVLPFKSNLIHRVLPLQAQLEVHGALGKWVTDPGSYSIPYLSREEEERFPDYRDQPTYSIVFEGYTHGGGGGRGRLMSSIPVVLLAVFLPPLLAAWMLSLASTATRLTYFWRVLFVAAIGMIVALNDDVLQMSFGPQAKDYLYFLAVNNLVAWTLTALVIAKMVRPTEVSD